MKTTIQKFLAGTGFLLLTHTLSFGQWQTNGPYNGLVHALITHNGFAYAGTGNGVFRSGDDGQTWSAANSGLQLKNISSFAGSGNDLFAGTYGDGIYLSSNGGTSWTSKNTGLTSLYVSTLLRTPSGLFAGSADGIFFSSSNGNTWTLANNGIPSTYVAYALAQMGDTVYAGTYGMGLYRSDDNGNNWNSVGNGFPSGVFVYALSASGNMLLAGTSAGVFKSSNRGVTWGCPVLLSGYR